MKLTETLCNSSRQASNIAFPDPLLAYDPRQPKQIELNFRTSCREA